MADERGRIDWYRVKHRALFPIAGIHVSRSLRRSMKRFRVTFDQDFEGVMRGCFRPGDNWLTEEFVVAYSACHREGWAHSCEVWEGDELVGGVYGLAIGSCFSAESMFHRRTDASKAALAALVDRCRELGFTVFDAQVMNPHLESLGAYEVSSREYGRLLLDALQRSTPWSRKTP